MAEDRRELWRVTRVLRMEGYFLNYYISFNFVALLASKFTLLNFCFSTLKIMLTSQQL